MAQNLLLDEEPLCILPSLAQAIGLNEAIVIQQIHYWLKNNERNRRVDHFIDGRWWTYNTYEEWQKSNFPFWSLKTVKRIFSELESKGLLLSAYHHPDKWVKKKWYTIDYAKLQVAIDTGLYCPDPSGQNDPMDRVKLSL